MGIGEQIAQKSIHALCGFEDITHEIHAVAIQLALIAPIQQLGIAYDHANRLAQIM